MGARGTARLEAGGEVYTFRMDYNAFCELEDATGEGAMAFLARLGKAGENLRLGDVRQVLRAGLAGEHPDITLKDTGQIIDDMGGLEVALAQIEAAIAAAFPDAPKGGAPGKAKARPRSTSPRS